MSPPPGPKELANRANAKATRERRALIPYAGKPAHQGGVPFTKNPRPEKPPPRKRRKWTRKT